MNILITPKRLSGTVPAVPSKSELHRYLILAALAGRDPLLCLPDAPAADDILATAEGLQALGLGSSCSRTAGNVPADPDRSAAPVTIDCRDSASTLRFLLPVASALLPSVTFTGSARLSRRPIEPLLAALETQGFRFSSRALPFTVTRDTVPGSPTYTLPGNVSSQFISGLLLAAPLTGGVTVRLSSPLHSGGYADMTVAILRAFGVSAACLAPSPDLPDAFPVFSVQEPVSLTFPESFTAGGDWSNAAFFLAAGVSVTGLSEDSPQKDRQITEFLTRLRNAEGEFILDCRDHPDLVPVLAVMAAEYRKDLTMTRVRRLRGKESDRVAAVCDMLRALGAAASDEEDTLHIAGSAAPLSGGVVDGRGDHRIVMAAALAASYASAPVTILGAEAVKKSYPSFWEDYQKAGGDIRVLQ